RPHRAAAVIRDRPAGEAEHVLSFIVYRAPATITLFNEAARALLRHKTRGSLTPLGIAIRIPAVVWVVAIGKPGTARAEKLLNDLGDNLVWVEAGSRNVAGVRTGTHGTTSLTLEDAEAIAREIPLIQRMSPQVDGNVRVVSRSGNWMTRY